MVRSQGKQIDFFRGMRKTYQSIFVPCLRKLINKFRLLDPILENKVHERNFIWYANIVW